MQWFIANKYHFIGWAAFLFYEIVIVGFYTGKFGALGTYIFHYFINISIFYIHSVYVLRYGFKNPRQIIWRIPLFLILEVSAYLLIIYAAYVYVNQYTHIITSNQPVINLQFFLGGLFRSVYFIIFGTGYYFLVTFIKERKKTESLEKQRLNNIIQLAKSENAYLRAQIQPHLLFNTLDFIYQNARDNSPVAAETIIALSGMMRYAVDSKHKEEFIELGDEIDQVENLINLHQLMANHTLQLRFWYDDEIRQERIIPMVLITLVENIFKHGDLTKPAEITLLINEINIVFETKNAIRKLNSSIKRNGTGIDNIHKRLKYTYGSKATLKYYFDDNEHFNIKITIEK
ncbi:sensor histidine kinase [Pedobacter lithocola]|uniref:sensor histidine kinase n=1 Tax=Pedobacter lithocola TaxID=1908239 RepID=UPI00366DD2ED